MNVFEDNLQHPADILAWYLDAGVDEAIGEQPVDRYQLLKDIQSQREAEAQKLLKSAEDERAALPNTAPAWGSEQSRAAGRSSGLSSGLSSGRGGPVAVRPQDSAIGEVQIKSAVDLAEAATNLDELRAALERFDGCPLKKSAMNLVFGDGSPDAKIVFIGEAPGADEDRQGIPFVGASGQLLDKMLASIGLDRSDIFITNTVFWRPPGNRTPNAGEIAVCLPFVERIIELIGPVVLVTLGAAATHSVLAQQGSVSRLRGRWFSFETSRMSHPIAASAMYHPAYLLRTPAPKRQTWLDLLAIKAKLAEHDTTSKP